MASRKSVKKAKKPARLAKKSGSRSWTLALLVAAAAVAAVLYAIMSPSGVFKPGSATPSVKVEGKGGTNKAETASKEMKPKAEKTGEIKPVVKVTPKPVVKAEPKPIPVPVAVVPPAPKCNGQPLSLFDIQGKVGNPSWKLVDVRPADRFAAGNIPGAVNIPAGEFDAAFAREQANLAQGAGIIIYGDGYSDPGVVDVCTKLSDKGMPRIYLFREGWSRWAPAP